MMVCSPSTLFVDYTLWLIPGIADNLVDSYQNLSEGDPYDCGLTSVPCDSNITNVNYDPILMFWFDLIVVYIVLTVSVVFGFFGNVFNIIIFSTNNIVSDSTNNLILALSVSDLISLCCIVLMLVSCFFCKLDEFIALTLFTNVFTYISIITRWFSLLSLDFVTVIAIQRAVAVVFPFKISTIFSRRNTNIIIIVLFVSCLCIMFPLSASLHPRGVSHPYFDKYIYLGIYYRLGMDFSVGYIFYNFNIRSVINLISVFTSGFLTVHMLNRQAKSRATLKADKASTETSTHKMSIRETKAIKMSLVICFVTFSIYSLSIAVNITSQVYIQELFRSPLFSVSEYTFLLLIVINSTFNFFLYIKMSEKYREVFCSYFNCLFKNSKGDVIA